MAEKKHEPEISKLIVHARRELKSEGLLDKDADYGGALGKAVMELIEVFAKQRHSGMSADLTLRLFGLLAKFEPLDTPVDDPKEWEKIDKKMMPAGSPDMWQYKRGSAFFSQDGGKNWIRYDTGQFGKSKPVRPSGIVTSA